jgi:hypothetical protein
VPGPVKDETPIVKLSLVFFSLRLILIVSILVPLKSPISELAHVAAHVVPFILAEADPVSVTGAGVFFALPKKQPIKVKMIKMAERKMFLVFMMLEMIIVKITDAKLRLSD